jgi:hypothetical protein
MQASVKGPIVGSILFSICLQASSVQAAEYRLCIGEFDQKCPVAHSVYAGCGADPQAVAASTCAIYLDGQKKSVPYRIVHQGSHDGNRCGYEWYSINCLDDK